MTKDTTTDSAVEETDAQEKHGHNDNGDDDDSTSQQEESYRRPHITNQHDGNSDYANCAQQGAQANSAHAQARQPTSPRRGAQH